MNPLERSQNLDRYLKRYVWWESPDWASQHPTVFLSNIMNMGTWQDILAVRKLVGDAALKHTLLHAPPGYFNYRSWDFWHHKFNLPIRDLPSRTDLK